MEFPKLEAFLTSLQKSWEEAAKSIKTAQEMIKKQFNKKQRNPQRLKVGNNVWLENKNIYLNRPLKKLDQKRYKPFRISENIGLRAFQLELPEGWMIHNVFNKDMLTRYREPHYKGQHMKLAPPLTIINEKRNTKLKKYRSIGNMKEECNTWCIGKIMEINMINGSQKQGFLMQKR